MTKKRTAIYGLFILCLAGAGFSGYHLYQEIRPRVQAEMVYDEIRAAAFPDGWPEQKNQANGPAGGKAEEAGQDPADPAAGAVLPLPDFASLTAWNQDVRAWLRAPGTDIDYPVVQGTDNHYYLTHTADKKKNLIGSVFMEYLNDPDFGDDVTVLYGHHIRGGRMFSSLSGYKKQAYYEAHPQVYLYTPQASYRVDLFAGQVLNGQTGTFPLNFPDEEAKQEWVKQLMNASTFKSSVYPGGQDQILALCTCSYEYNDARYVVYGIMNELEEKRE